MIFAKKKILVWCDDPPEDRVISIFAGCLANHDRAHSMVTLLYYLLYQCQSTCFTSTKVQILTPEALRARSLYHKVFEILLSRCEEVCRAHDDALVLLLFSFFLCVQRSYKACHLHYKACHLHLHCRGFQIGAFRPIRVDHTDFFKWLLKLIHSLKPYSCEPLDAQRVLVHMRVHESHNEELNRGM